MKNLLSRRLFLRNSAIATTGIAFFSSTNIIHAINNDSCPYNGYNPYIEEKTDLRTSLLGKHLNIEGKIFDAKGKFTLSNVTVEVWHLSPNSNKYKHRGKTTTNNLGEYQFITQIPNRDNGKMPRIYFKVSSDTQVYFTELLIGTTGAHITSKHWKENKELNKNLLPTTSSFLNTTTINFNITH